MIWHPSPNFGERRGGLRPELVVLHYTAMNDCRRARDWLCTPEAEVSAHYLIGRDGTIWHMVEEEMRAWHAGAGSWGGAGDVNSRSIGIELDNDGAGGFAEPLMAALEALLAEILRRWAIPAKGVIGHSDMAPGRKIDPGPHFDWQRLARRGLSVWPGMGIGPGGAGGLSSVPGGPSSSRAPDGGAGAEKALRADLRRFGYPDAPLQVLLPAFRLRFRPGAEGPADAHDAAMARELATRWPVDRQVFDA